MSLKRYRRRDLDVLRGVAVLGVVTYHYFPLRFSQGLNGVDVFLVVSGYLVTQSLLITVPMRPASLLTFYFRRLKRTVPGLVITLAVCIASALFVLSDYQLEKLALSSFYAVTFQINFTLHNSIDYFNPDNRMNPLMHLWSLALEEQFYLLLPILIWGLQKARNNRKRLFLLLSSTSVMIVAPFLTRPSSVFNSHYLPQARAWPLLIGVTLAVANSGSPEDPEHLVGRLSRLRCLKLLGIAILMICTFTNFLPQDVRIQRIIIVTITVVVITTGNSRPSGSWLESRLLAYFGARSYGLYLVHWPLLALTISVIGHEPTRAEKVGLFCLSLAFAELLYQLVDNHFLRKDITQRLFLGLVVTQIFSAFVTFGFSKNVEYLNRPVKTGTRGAFLAHYVQLREEWYTSLDSTPGYRNVTCKHYLNKLILTPATPGSILSECNFRLENTVGVVWGDSFALALGFGVSQLNLVDQSVHILHADSCPPMLKPGTIRNYETDECLRSNELAINLIERISPDWILLSQRQSHEMNDWKSIVTWIRSVNSRVKIIIAGPVPQFDDDLPQMITNKYWSALPVQLTIGKDVIRKHQQTNNRTRMQIARLTDVAYVDIFQLFCNTNSCDYRLPDQDFGGLITWDSGHMTHFASKHVADKLVKPLLQAANKSN